jgi:hypothetical protein
MIPQEKKPERRNSHDTVPLRVKNASFLAGRAVAFGGGADQGSALLDAALGGPDNHAALRALLSQLRMRKLIIAN